MMTKLKIILFFIIYIPISLSSQNSNLWRGYVTYPNGANEDDEKICDIVKNSQLRIVPTLSSQANYSSNFIYKDTICLSRDFSYEVKMRNGNDVSSLTDFEASFGFFSNGKRTNISLAEGAANQINSKIQIGDSVILKNSPKLLVNFNDWRIVKISFKSDTISLTVDSKEVYQVIYKHNICNIDIINFALKGAGAIDWIRVYDSRNTMVWQEEFQNCNSFTQGIICDPFRLDKSITISKPCSSDTLTLSANFPAMNYVWTTPLLTYDSNKVAKFINPQNGIYDLTANINRCFTFSKNFSLNIIPETIINREVSVCTGKSYQLPKGTLTSIPGTYRDTLKTKVGCDSIIITKLSFNAIPVNKQNASICNGQNYSLPSGKIVSNNGFYTDTVKNTEGCLVINEINLSVNSSFNSTTNIKICEGQSYTLPKGRIITSAGAYNDTFRLTGGCDSVVTTNVTISPKPSIKITVNQTGELQEGDALPLSINEITGAIYTWLENGVLFSQNINVTNFTIKGGETTYKVIVKSDLGCIAEDSIKIVALPKIELPNAFSPNGDNLNDNFTIVVKNNNEKYYSIQQFLVYDRFGNQVYNNENGLKGWDGTRNGNDLSSDVYLYIIKVSSLSGKTLQFSGEITLIR